MPVVRNRTVIHIMEWLKENRDSLSNCQTTHVILVNLMLYIITLKLKKKQQCYCSDFLLVKHIK